MLLELLISPLADMCVVTVKEAGIVTSSVNPIVILPAPFEIPTSFAVPVRVATVGSVLLSPIKSCPLVKTAVAGADPNYGRILMAIGKTEENLIANNLTIKFGKFTVVENGQQVDNYDEEAVKEYMKWDAIEINIELNMGKSNFTVYTCDFTKDYIDINTDYSN